MVLITPLQSNAETVNKAYKVCPEIVTVKDTPCRVSTPSSSIVQRDIVKEDPREKEISELKNKIKILEDLLENYANKLQTR